MTGTLGFFNNAAQLDALLAWAATDGRPMTLIAASAQADYAAERRGLAYHAIESLYDEVQLTAEGIANFPRLHALCRLIDDGVAETAALAEIAGDAPTARYFSAFQYLYHLKLLFDPLLARGFALYAALTEVQPRRIAGFPAPVPPGPADAAAGFPAYPGASLLMDMLPVWAARFGLEMTALPDPAPPAPAAPPPADAPSRWDELLSQIKQIRAGGHVMGPSVALGGYWSDRGVIEALQRRHIPLFRLSHIVSAADAPPADAALNDALTALCDRLERSEAYRSLTQWAGAGLGGLAAPAWRHFITGIIPRHLQLARLTAERFALLENTVLLSSFPIAVDTVAAGPGARAAGRRDVTLQHGGAWGYMVYPLDRYGDGAQSSRYLCYGQGVVDTMQRFTQPPAAEPEAPDHWPRRTTPIAVGGADLAALYRRWRAEPAPAGIGPRGVRILYVSTNLCSDSRYFSWLHPPEITYAREQRALIAHCAALPGAELTIRPYMQDRLNPLLEWLHDQPRRCRLAAHTPFPQLVGDADLIVVDCPTTTLLQALTTRAQVVVYADEKVFKFHPGARSLLERRAWVTTRFDDCLSTIDAAVQACRAGTGRPVDDAFLFRYGCPPDGDPAEIAADAILAAISG